MEHHCDENVEYGGHVALEADGEAFKHRVNGEHSEQQYGAQVRCRLKFYCLRQAGAGPDNWLLNLVRLIQIK